MKDGYGLFLGEVMISRFYDTLDNIKRSLFIKFGFLHYQKQMFSMYDKINPEIKSIHIPIKYLNMSSDLNCSDKLNIRKFDIKTGIWTKINFNVINYYNNELKLINIAAEYGYAVKETFRYLIKSPSDKYILVYIPDEYRNVNVKSYKNLKESEKIKNIIDNLNYKVKKITRHGKTAITIDKLDELIDIMKQLKNNDYFVVYYGGNNIKKLDKRFFKIINLIKQ